MTRRVPREIIMGRLQEPITEARRQVQALDTLLATLGGKCANPEHTFDRVTVALEEVTDTIESAIARAIYE